MRFTKLFGVGMLCVGMLSWNAYGIDTSDIKKVKAASSLDKERVVTPPGPAAGFVNTCADIAGADALVASGGTLSGSPGTNDYGDVGVTDGQDPAGCDEGAGWGSGGGDAILEFTVDTTGPWTLTTCPGYSDPGSGGPAGGSGTDTSLMILGSTVACPGDGSIACNGDGGGNCPGFQSEIVNLTLTAGTTYYLLVDHWSAGTTADFTVAYHGPCADDADCTARDQDVFCNGDETCGADGLCSSSGDPCAGTGTPVCNEGGRICEACTASADPDATCGDDGNACNGIESCDTATGGCIVTDPCPCGYCQNGTCQDGGACVQTGDPCRRDEDCPFFTSGQTCDLPGTGSHADCWDGHSAVGPNVDCPAGEVCVPNGNNGVVCDENPCHVYRTDNSGYFGPGQGGNTYAADDMRMPAAPAGRDVVSYQLQIVGRDGTVPGCVTGPYDLTMELWTAVNTDPLVDPNAGLPDGPIAGTECSFKDVPNGVGGPVGTPGRTTLTAFTCDAATGLTGGTLVDGVQAGIDDWMLYTTDTLCQGFSISGAPALSQGVIIGATGFSFFGDSGGIPPGLGGVGWGLGAFGPNPPFESHFGNSFVCVQVVGPCCVGVAGCEMLSAADCAAQGGSYQGDNTCSNPITCEETGDGDGIADLCDNCPDDNNIDQADCDGDGEGDACEANEDDQDRDFDGCCNGVDACPDDAAKCANEGQCGCGNSEDDADGDGTADCNDPCVNDPNKVDPGICGCGTADVGDEDGDGVLDCVDQCRGVDDAIFAPECDGAIPTVSEWGLVILALLLLVAGKVYFGRRRALV